MNRQIDNVRDQLLVMDAQDGSNEAIAKLFDKWQKRLWGHAYRLVRNEQAAWDVTQQSWLSIIKYIGRLNDPSYFKPWAFRIVSNNAIDWIKENKKRSAVNIDDVPEIKETENQISGIEELIEKLEMKKKIIVLLHYFEKLSIDEIATAMGIPTGTVKSRLYNARNELKKLLGNEVGF